jgi:hypothetical protein
MAAKGYISGETPHSSNEPVEKVTFLKTASFAGSKIENYFLLSKVITILCAVFVFSRYFSYPNTLSPNPAPLTQAPTRIDAL